MNLLEFLTHAQAHDEDAILYLFQKFKSLILKYASVSYTHLTLPTT